jgi:hypothetical protein
VQAPHARPNRGAGTANGYRRCVEGHQSVGTRRAKSARCVGRIRSASVQCV